MERFEYFLIESDEGAPIIVPVEDYYRIASWMIRQVNEDMKNITLHFRVRGFRLLFGRQLQIAE